MGDVERHFENWMGNGGVIPREGHASQAWGVSWDVLGGLLGPLGGALEHLEGDLGRLGDVLGHFVVSWGVLGASLGRL